MRKDPKAPGRGRCDVPSGAGWIILEYPTSGYFKLRSRASRNGQSHMQLVKHFTVRSVNCCT